MIIPATTLHDVHLELAKKETSEHSMVTDMASLQKVTFIGVKASTDWKVD